MHCSYHHRGPRGESRRRTGGLWCERARARARGRSPVPRAALPSRFQPLLLCAPADTSQGGTALSSTYIKWILVAIALAVGVWVVARPSGRNKPGGGADGGNA